MTSFYIVSCTVCGKDVPVAQHIGRALEKGALAGVLCSAASCRGHSMANRENPQNPNICVGPECRNEVQDQIFWLQDVEFITEAVKDFERSNDGGDLESNWTVRNED